MITIRNVETSDQDQWAVLFRAYRDFYELSPDEAVIDRVWSWITDPEHVSRGLVAVSDDNEEGGAGIVGIAHHRHFPRPSTGTVGLYLDDLFVDPDRRGRRIGEELLQALTTIAISEGLSVVRWITADDNTVAQRLYDRLARRTRWLTYDLPPR
jgi:ribosomal protein S18 acetylase RimI-like enzyme